MFLFPGREGDRPDREGAGVRGCRCGRQGEGEGAGGDGGGQEEGLLRRRLAAPSPGGSDPPRVGGLQGRVRGL